MKRILLIVLPLVWVGAGSANEEITVDLPGGATMEFVWIEPGMYMMGSPESEPGRYSDESPQHEVTITWGFWLGKYELTQEQWKSVMGTAPWLGQDYVQTNPNHPAVYISWDDVQDLIEKLNEATGEAIYRMPTEAEKQSGSMYAGLGRRCVGHLEMMKVC